jgi:hypothetical protein
MRIGNLIAILKRFDPNLQVEAYEGEDTGLRVDSDEIDEYGHRVQVDFIRVVTDRD